VTAKIIVVEIVTVARLLALVEARLPQRLVQALPFDDDRAELNRKRCELDRKVRDKAGIDLDCSAYWIVANASRCELDDSRLESGNAEFSARVGNRSMLVVDNHFGRRKRTSFLVTDDTGESHCLSGRCSGFDCVDALRGCGCGNHQRESRENGDSTESQRRSHMSLEYMATILSRVPELSSLEKGFRGLFCG
jgi:hypothetical protein